ncbi:uncharacterized protein ACBR49_013103 [Aulostomus maculatus]
MSVDETKILFEGFLQKRKDVMSHLRGYYYIYTVQSVRELQQTVGSKGFMFEIIMTNGKRKVLAAETAALRREWVAHLWQAMHLSTSVVCDQSCSHHRVCEQRDLFNSSPPACSHSVSLSELTAAGPRSADLPPGHIHCNNLSTSSFRCLTEELNVKEATYQNTLATSHYQQHNGYSLNNPPAELNCAAEEGEQEGDYDVLPLRNGTISKEPAN